jgi:hypothetical protein
MGKQNRLKQVIEVPSGEIYDALYDISQEMSYNPTTRHEAELLASHMKSFKPLYAVLLFGTIY